jgi:hypothetical protein
VRPSLRLPALVLGHLRSALLPAPCRWNDTVHTQILDHLPVVIEAMSRGKRCQEEARGRPATTAAAADSLDILTEASAATTESARAAHAS